ncbi:cytochrome P450 4C1-like isoform X1 [Bombyx mori]
MHLNAENRESKFRGSISDKLGMLHAVIWFLFCVTVYAYWRTVCRRRNIKLPSPPDLPRRLPFIGHAHIFFGDSLHAWKVIKWLSKETDKRGGVASISMGPHKGFCVTDPDDCLTISNVCLKKDYYYSFATPWLGNGLLTGSVATWRLHRRLLGPAFSQRVLNGFISAFNCKSRALVTQLEDRVGRGPFDHVPYLSFNNLETICQTALGIKMEDHSAVNQQYEQALHDIFAVLTERFQKFWLHYDFVYNRTKLKEREDQIIKVLHNMSNTALQQRKSVFLQEHDAASDKPTDKSKTFIDIILETCGGAFSDKDVREEVDNIIFAGHDTISTVLTTALSLLGSHPDVQDKVYNEVRRVLGDAERDVTKEDYLRLEYLEAVLKESMRMYPVAPVIARYSDAEVKLKNYTAPAGSGFILLLWGVHQHRIWGADADQFRPERWLEAATLPDPSFFAGFSTGRRSCIGKVYAMMSMKTTLSFLLRRYRVSSDVTDLEFKLEAILRPHRGHYIAIERRSKDDK